MNKEYREQVKKEGRHFAYVVLGVLLFLFAIAAFAQNMVAKDANGNSMTLYTEPCADGKILAMLDFQGVKTADFKAGLMNYEGKDYSACWVPGPDGFIYVLDEAGDMSRLPMGMFRGETGV